MAIKKLVQTGEDTEGNFNVMDGLSFAQALNNNADELSTTTKVDLAVHNTPQALRKAFKEQSGKTGYHTPGGPDDIFTHEEEGAPVNSPSELKDGLAQIYNKAIGGGSQNVLTSNKAYNFSFLNLMDVDKINRLGAENVSLGVEASALFITNSLRNVVSAIHILSFDELSDENKLFSIISSLEPVSIGGQSTYIANLYLYDELYEKTESRIIDPQIPGIETVQYDEEGWYKALILSGGLDELSTVTVALVGKTSNVVSNTFYINRIESYKNVVNPATDMPDLLSEVDLDGIAELEEIDLSTIDRELEVDDPIVFTNNTCEITSEDKIEEYSNMILNENNNLIHIKQGNDDHFSMQCGQNFYSIDGNSEITILPYYQNGAVYKFEMYAHTTRGYNVENN